MARKSIISGRSDAQVVLSSGHRPCSPFRFGTQLVIADLETPRLGRMRNDADTSEARLQQEELRKAILIRWIWMAIPGLP